MAELLTPFEWVTGVHLYTGQVFPFMVCGGILLFLTKVSRSLISVSSQLLPCNLATVVSIYS